VLALLSAGAPAGASAFLIKPFKSRAGADYRFGEALGCICAEYLARAVRELIDVRTTANSHQALGCQG
jgi:hypothetical protein